MISLGNATRSSRGKATKPRDIARQRRDHGSNSSSAAVTWSLVTNGPVILALDEQGHVTRWHGMDFLQSRAIWCSLPLQRHCERA